MKSGTKNASQIKDINELFRLACLENVLLVRQCDVRWNHIEASLVLMYTKMRDLGFWFDGENIIIPSEEAQDV
jgi:hypothetical protein